jgi:polyisoprenoid-binding protein YceI
MLQVIRHLALAASVVALGSAARAADTFAVDPVHSSVSFMTSHAGISYIHGRFNDFSGKFVIDPADPAKSSFALSVKIDSVDTNNQKRDEHLHAPDYFDSKQFPTMSFQSTQVKPVSEGYEVTGDFTLHGVTKPLTLKLKGGQTAENKGVVRIGFMTSPIIKRSEFGVSGGIPLIGDDVYVNIAVEGVKE